MNISIIYIFCSVFSFTDEFFIWTENYTADCDLFNALALTAYFLSKY